MMEKLSFKNLRARRSSIVEQTVQNILEAEEGTALYIGYPEWFTEGVREGKFSDTECEAIIEAVFLTLSTVLWERLTEELEKFRREQD